MLRHTKNQAKIKWSQKEFLKAMKRKFAEDPTIPTTKVFGVAPNRKVGHHVTLIPYAYEGRKL